MSDTGLVESVERIIPASADRIFDLLCDPDRHLELDGSGTLRGAKGQPDRLSLGSTFGMSMKLGIPYSMVNTVIEYEQDRRLAWQTRPPGKIPGKLAGGRIWRYELEPVAGGTLVRESWDISQEVVKALVKPARAKTREAMAATLERIETILAAEAAS